MKKILSLLFVFLMSVVMLAQTNANSVTYKYVWSNDQYGSVVGESGYSVLTAVQVDISFTSDSTLSQLTSAIKVPEYAGVNPQNYPVSFRLKAVGTYGVPNRAIYIYALGTSATDTVAVDSVCNHATNQTELDTVGVLTFSSGGKFGKLGFKVFIRDITADINSGTLSLIFPIPAEARLRRLN